MLATKPIKVLTAASSLAKKEQLSFITIPIADFYGQNELVVELIRSASENSNSPPFALTNVFPKSQIGFSAPSSSETHHSRPNLNSIVLALVELANDMCCNIGSAEPFVSVAVDDVRYVCLRRIIILIKNCVLTILLNIIIDDCNLIIEI